MNTDTHFLPRCLAVALACLCWSVPCWGNNADAPDTDTMDQLQLLNRLTESEMRREYERLEANVEKQLIEMQAQNAQIQTRLNQRDNDMGNYIDAISWVSGIVIGFVGILFGIGAFILYRENQDVTRKAQEQLADWNQKAANLENTFDQWFVDAKKEYSAELEQLSRIMRLRILLDQDQPSAADIYPDLSQLYAHPKLEYLPIFKKVLTLDIGTDLRRSTEQAIEQLVAQQKSET